MIWIIPVAIAAVLAVPVAVALRGVSRDVAALRRELAAFTSLREPILELRTEATAVARRVPELQKRARPSATSAP